MGTKRKWKWQIRVSLRLEFQKVCGTVPSELNQGRTTMRDSGRYDSERFGKRIFVISLNDVLFQQNKVDVNKGVRYESMASVTLYKNDVAIASTEGLNTNSWSGLNFISNSVNIEYTATSSSSIVGAYWGQCTDVSCIQGSINTEC